MASGAQYCIECEMRGYRVKAVRSYISPFSGEETHLCERHYRDALHVMEAFEKGPYTKQTETGIGHKGGASANMAELLCGSKAADARKVLLGILKEPLTAEQASRKAGFDPDYGSPRISELIAKGLVTKHDRKGRSDRGNPCGRYIITDIGKGLAA
ncbi:MAG: hypothetical protein AAFO74_12930 [Pseudomonadota bacterium]